MPKASNPLTEYCELIAATISDYRKAEIPTPDAKHVMRCVQQFPVTKRRTILRETVHLFHRGYFSKDDIREFLRGLIDNDELTGGQSPKSFWKRVNFLRLQGRGSSQEEMLNILVGMLKKRFGFWTRDCGSKSGPHLYLDDFIFTGTTVRTSLLNWIEKAKPTKPNLHLVFIAFHRYGQYNAQTSTGKAISQVGGTATYWRMAEIEDRKQFASSCDVLRPRKVYSDPAIRAYTHSMRYEPALRADQTSSEFYKSENGRRVLEHQLLKAGLRIRGFCSDPETAMRPLGFSALDCFGTGSVVATYRNCPNTCPLAWWWGDPHAKHGPLSRWYPLLPRKYRIY